MAPRRGSIAPGGVLVPRPCVAIPVPKRRPDFVPLPGIWPAMLAAPRLLWSARRAARSRKKSARSASGRSASGRLSVGRGSSWRAERRDRLSRPPFVGQTHEGLSLARLLAEERRGKGLFGMARDRRRGRRSSSFFLRTAHRIGRPGPKIRSARATCRSRNRASGPRRPPAPRFRLSGPRWPCRCARRCRSRSARSCSSRPRRRRGLRCRP